MQDILHAPAHKHKENNVEIVIMPDGKLPRLHTITSPRILPIVKAKQIPFATLTRKPHPGSKEIRPLQDTSCWLTVASFAPLAACCPTPILG